MRPLPHHYEVRIADGPSGHGMLSTNGIPSLPTTTPVEFDGPGDAWTPEHLLLAAVEACFFLTFRGIARRARVSVEAVAVEATGTVDRVDGVTRFTEIVLRPRVQAAKDTDPDAIARVLAKAEQACLVSASLSTPVRVVPTIHAFGDTSRDDSEAA